MMAEWLDELNPKQKEAATQGEGPVLVVAGAGTGKTKTLAYRVAWLLHEGVAPDRLLLLTFTRRAAHEMISRAQGILPGALGAPRGQDISVSKVWGGTFHAVANRLLRIYGKAIALEPEFTVTDEADAADLMGIVRAELGYSSSEKRFPRKGTVLAIYSRVVNSREPLETVLKKQFPWCQDAEEGLRQIFSEYTKRKQERRVLDYDDLLLFWNAMLDIPQLAEQIGGRFDHVLVDEYQDTNVIQAETLQKLRLKNKNIMVVGDDAQSIYSFRAATIQNILDFPKQFPGTKIVTLEENYRSVQPILDLGNAVMASAKYRYTKELWSKRQSKQKPVLTQCMDEAEQCRIVCETILKHLEEGIPLHQQAVLFRAGHHSDQLEVELARRKIPFHKYGGLRFIEAAHVKDILAFLRVLENPRDELSWFRILELLEGVGPKTAQRVLQHFHASAFAFEALGTVKMPPATEEQYKDLVKVLMSLHKSDRKVSVASQIERLRKFYEPMLPRLYDNPTPRKRDLEQIELIAQRYRSRTNFITDLTLDPPSSTADLAGRPHKDDDYLILSTMHSAKGCEWRVVQVIHAADGMIPSDMALDDEAGLEEERRLFYVAITRAKDWLYIIFPLRYYYRPWGMADDHLYAQLTRFIGPDVLPLVEQRTVDAPTTEDVPVDIRTEVDIRKKISNLWGAPPEKSKKDE